MSAVLVVMGQIIMQYHGKVVDVPAVMEQQVPMDHTRRRVQCKYFKCNRSGAASDATTGPSGAQNGRGAVGGTEFGSSSAWSG